MKCKKCFRIVSWLLAIAMLTASLSGYYASSSYGKEQAQITDVLELQVNGGEKQLMIPYVNARYEAAFLTVEGANQYTVIKNGKVIEQRVVDTYPGTEVIVRYLPYMKNMVIDSLNDSGLFKKDAAWVGELTKLNHVRQTGEKFEDWEPGSQVGLMEDLGGGIYRKTFQFIDPLPEEVTLEYKVAFGKSWDIPSIGGKSYSNLKMTIPAGTQQVSIWADSVAMKCETSVELGDFLGVSENEELNRRQEGSVRVSLAGNFVDHSGQDGWELIPLGSRLYGNAFWMPQGQWEYNCIFDSNIGRSGQAGQLSLKRDSYVYYLYDSKTNLLYDSVNHGKEINALLNFGRPLSPEELDQRAYSGNDLGASYNSESTQFKVWAPTASAVKVNLYSTGASEENSLIQSADMQPSQNGTWSTVIQGDLNGVYYTYSVTVRDETNETVDLYAKAVGVNGNRGMIVNLAETNPEGWEGDTHVARANSTDAIIWEAHVRDFSVSADSGISPENRGKYLAFTEHGTTVRGEGKIPTGIDHLKKLGVNYIHLLPAQDYENDEKAPAYNWGYSTKNYFVPEGAYSSDPSDGYKRIREFKEMVKSLHESDIGVVMDVVYNHTAQTQDSWFNMTVPGYYYRLDKNGEFLDRTLCGNETASERAMFRKFMVDSILYWAKEYHVDGFRFDLMAIHDTETMNAIRRELDQEGLSHVILYGEPWYAADNWTELAPGYLAANKDHAGALDDRIAMFNSYTRTGIIGGIDGSATGFVQGNVPAVTGKAAEGTDESLLSAISASSSPERGTSASPAWAKNPSQSLSYTSCHDDCTLWDWLYHSLYGAPENKDDYGRRDEMLVNMNKLAVLVNMTSQGSVLFQAGEEFGRTKYGDSDSYQSPDHINQLKWSRIEQFSDLNEYYCGLIAMRKRIGAFRDPSTESLKTMHVLADDRADLVAYTIDNEKFDPAWKKAAVILNASFQEQTVSLPDGDQGGSAVWGVIADREHAGTTILSWLEGNQVTIPAQSGMVLVRTEGTSGAEGTSEGESTSEAEGADKDPAAENAKQQETEEKLETGRQISADGVQYYDEDGNLLTGWVEYDKDSKTAQPFNGTVDSDNIFYCDSNGNRVSGWQYLWAPSYVNAEGVDGAAVMEDDEKMYWYYFKNSGKLCRDEKKEIDGVEYCFDTEGRRMDGWIYETADGERKTYVRVDADTPEDQRAEYNQDYSRYLYADPSDGKLVKKQWRYLIYPGQEEELNLEDDGRSFYFKSNGHLETGAEGMVKTAVTVDQIGTYKLRDYSLQINIVKIDGEYYALDNVAGSIGDVLYLSGGSDEIPDGFYSFKGENNKMLTGEAFLKEDGDTVLYYYRFSKVNNGEHGKGQGVTGVFDGKLYYHGLAVGAQDEEKYEAVYLPTIAKTREGATGLFLVDEKGTVKTGKHLEAADGTIYKVEKNGKNSDKYGYVIYKIEEVEHGKDIEHRLTADQASLIFLNDVDG